MIILIADDEYLARVAIRGLLEDADDDLINEILEVSDGVSLVEAAERRRPDIAFVDIRMPEMDGLEAIRRAKEVSPLTEWVILTGFSEFEFAKKAIELHVSTYMLKPVISQDFQRTYQEIRTRHLDSLQVRTRRIERDVLSLINGGEEPADTQDETVHLLLFSTACADLSAAEIAVRLRRILMPHITAQCLIGCVCISETEIVILSSWYRDVGFDRWKRASSQITEYIFNEPCCEQLLVAQDEHCCGVRGSSERIAGLRRIKEIRLCLEPCTITDYDQIEALVTSSLVVQWGSIVAAMHAAYRAHDLLQYRDMLERLQMLCGEFEAVLPRERVSIIMKNIEALFSLPEPVHRLDIAGLIEELGNIGEEDLRRRQSPDRHVDSVLRYLETHYHEDIGIDTISRMLGVTPNYLSMIISRSTGERFSDHIARIRVEQAEVLLTTTDLTIQEVSRSVGYRSVRHFTQLFQRRAGTYPSTFRKRQRGV